MLDDLIICIPTFKRKHLSIFNLIDSNKDIMFTLCVRKDEYNSLYYNEPQFKRDNISYMLLDGCNCIGETREQILQNVYKLNYKYCLMMDDTQITIKDIKKGLSFKEILNDCISRFKTDKFKENAFAYIFNRRDNKIKYNYFGAQLCQTYMLNVETCKKNNLHFKPMREVGIEDLMFYYEAARKNLVALSNGNYLRVGQPPSVKKEGGCHVGNELIGEHIVQQQRVKIFEAYCKRMNYTNKFVKKVNSILWPGTYYYKFDCKFANLQLLGEYNEN